MPHKFFLAVLVSLLSLLSIGTVYAANPFGFKIGQATYEQVKAELSPIVDLKLVGVNKYSGGKMITATEPETLGYNGLKQVTMIFDHQEKLSAVVMRLIKSNSASQEGGFLAAYKKLREKYLPVFKNLQTTGSMSAGFTTPSQDVHIRMSALETSQEFDLQYLSDDFWKRYEIEKKSISSVQESAEFKNKQEDKEIF